MMKFTIHLISILLISGCASKFQNGNKEMKSSKQEYRYLALGDSYTIGESVDEKMRWPVQLSHQLNNAGVAVKPPRIIATTGWTTDELTNAINEAQVTETYDLVSLLIGVNNQYRQYPFSTYEKEFTQLLEMAIMFANGDTDKVFVVSIPDYGVTPFGQKKNPSKIAIELDQYNAKAKEVCLNNNVIFINITDISKNASGDSTLVASDGLHPSGTMYTQWVGRVFPEVKRLFDNK